MTAPTAASRARTVCLTVDAEQDCPPYLSSWRGMEGGAPELMSLLREVGVRATVFTTGDTARRFPDFVTELAVEGHELGCHGMTHRAFSDMSFHEAEEEVVESSAVLRDFATVTSFRAPYLRLPDDHLPILESHGYRVDSSRGLYKPAHWRPSAPTTLERIPASVTSSWLRLPARVRDAFLRRLPSPVVLFVHPWEFVDMSSEPVPWDCRAGTGRSALGSLRDVLRLYQEEGADFVTLTELASGGA